MKITKKILTATTALILMLILLAGCGGSDDNVPIYGNVTQDNNLHGAPPHIQNPPAGNQPENNPTTTPPPTDNTPTTTPAPEATSAPILAPEQVPALSVPLQTLINVSSFLNGVAWVQGNDSLWRGIDRQGSVLFVLDDGVVPLSHFYNDVALVNRGGTRELINIAGNVVSSPTSGDYDEIMRIVPSNGMIIVYRHINTFALTEHQYGIINSDGSWHMEMQWCPFLDRIRQGVDAPAAARAYGPGWRAVDLTRWDVLAPYIGGGHLVLRQPDRGDPRYQLLLYSLYTCDVVLPEDRTEIPYLWISPFSDFLLSTHSTGGEVALLIVRPRVNEFDFSVFAITSSGIMTELIVLPSIPWGTGSSVVLRNYRNGLFYYSDIREQIWHPESSYPEYGEHQGFFDRQGNKVIDLTEFGNRITIRDDFLDGYAFISIANEQGNTFFTFIDKTGEFMFEPIPNNPSIRNIGGGLFTMEADGDIVVMDMSMNQLFNLGRSGVISLFSEGIAWVRYQDEIFFVDTNMNRLFN